jgi:hypothetical protein
MSDVPMELLADAARIAWVARSYRHWTGEALVAEANDPVTALWRAPQVILTHGVEADPVFFFANRTALAAFEATLPAMLAMPSRLSAEAPLRAERQELLDRVTRDGFIPDYAGIRISAKGRRFAIARATVWTVIDEAGARLGQAACFAAPAHVA